MTNLKAIRLARDAAYLVAVVYEAGKRSTKRHSVQQLRWVCRKAALAAFTQAQRGGRV